MNKFFGWFTKIKIMFFSVIGSIFFTLLYIGIPYNYLCNSYTSSSDCGYWLKYLVIILMVFPIILFFSILTFKIKESIFLFWKKFTIFYLLVYLFIILITPSNGGDFIHIVKGTVGIFLTLIYSIISLIIIIYKSLKKE